MTYHDFTKEHLYPLIFPKNIIDLHHMLLFGSQGFKRKGGISESCQMVFIKCKSSKCVTCGSIWFIVEKKKYFKDNLDMYLVVHDPMQKNDPCGLHINSQFIGLSPPD